MIYSRMFAALGATLAVLFALVLVLWGAALVRAISVLAAAMPELARELNLTQLAALGAALGLCLTVYGLGEAQRRFHVDWLTKAGISAGGLLVVVSGALLFSGLREVQSQLAGLTIDVAQAAQPEAVRRLVSVGVQRMTVGYFTLFSAAILLAIGVWKLFWTYPQSEANARSTFWTSALTLGILSALSFGLMFYWAAGNGYTAFHQAATAAPQGDLVPHLNRLLTKSQAGAVCLFLSGLILAITGLGFRTVNIPDS